MSENNLFQFAQVIAELPISPSQKQQPVSNDNASDQNSRPYLQIRKVKVIDIGEVDA